MTDTDIAQQNSHIGFDTIKEGLKTILTAFLAALAGAALSTAVVGGILLNRVSMLEEADKEQLIEMRRLDRDGSQQVRLVQAEIAGLKLQYTEIVSRDLIQIEKLARIETLLSRIDRNAGNFSP